MQSRTQPGNSFPLGSTVRPDGVNFSLFSKNSTFVELLLFDHPGEAKPATAIALDPRWNRTYHYWHVFVPGIQAGQIYGYRAFGPSEPQHGLRFDPNKLLLDPYGKTMAMPDRYSRISASVPGDNCATAMKSVVVDPTRYDWEGDVPLKRPFAQTVIYELHVRGFTRHPSSGLSHETRGTYRGLIDKIPYLRDLGVTAVELLPVFQFDEQDAPCGLVNYWGYSPISFFVPHHGYSSRKDHLGPMDEFRDMVKALHRSGIEIILDVVFNHTAEGDHAGPTLCYRGLENAAYYMLEEDRSRYADYAGTGNTLNANQPIVRRLILDSLRYWVESMHVDGFRFDLASILSRDENGRPLANPPILWDIESDPVLAGTKLIAEAWDAGGLYQVGSFIGDSWKEWNGRFRDDVRSFLKGDNGTVRLVARRLLGSPDLYGHEEREPEQSLNFVTCHDGFTLNDLVSYNHKHNKANGEDNRDGTDFNLSWNCGVEGPTDDPSIERLRNRQVKNFLALTLLSVGAPMLLMGDEVRRTQRGNNNAYCQDNDISWFDWTRLGRHADIHRFVRMLLLLRSRRDMVWAERGPTLNEILRRARIDWHGVKLDRPDWNDESHSLALTAGTLDGRFLVHVIVNAYWEPLAFELPSAAKAEQGWRRLIDTGLDSPDDICDGPDAPLVPGDNYLVQSRSAVVLFALNADSAGQDSASPDNRNTWSASTEVL
ncbi:MAG: glycogen debranching protein GlgX [Nitrospira sp.]